MGKGAKISYILHYITRYIHSDTPHPSSVYTLSDIEAGQKACVLQIPLLLSHVAGPGLALAQRLEQEARSRAWALEHTISVRIGENAEASYKLKDCIWRSACLQSEQAPSKKERQKSGVYTLEVYFKENVIDRDLEYLRELDPSLKADMTVAAGRLRSAFEQCVTSHTTYTNEILKMLDDQKLG